MRWIRLAHALVRAKFKSTIKATDTTSLTFRVWLTEIDVSIMNHAAIVTVLEAGRIDALVRSTFFKIASKNKWYFPLQAITVQYYRPLKIFQKAQLYSRISFADEKWIYMEQKIIRNEKTIATCLVKGTVKNGRETVPMSKLIKELNITGFPEIKYDLIKSYELENKQMNKQLIDDWII